VYNEYPRQFWLLIGVSFIDMLGGALIFPFLTLYITKRFEVGMTEVGLLFGLFSVASIVGGTIGGALTDRFGRKGMIIFGLITSALSGLTLGFVNVFTLFFAVVLFMGLFSNSAGPARQAMVADLLSEEKRAQGFAIIRVVANIAVAIGPIIGGFLATRSYLLLFICDAAASLLTAIFTALVIRETKPASPEGEPEETVGQTFAGYWKVLRDGTFVMFAGACILMAFVSMQLTTTLPVFLQNVHGVPEQGFGAILSLNATMVVLLQFLIIRRVERYRQLMVMAAGMVLYGFGFCLYSFVSGYAWFLVAVAVLTLGEMTAVPPSQAMASNLAPKDMRGRYMAIFAFTWMAGVILGPLVSGLIMDNADPRQVWYATGLVSLAAAVAFALLQRRVGRRVTSAMEVEIEAASSVGVCGAGEVRA
jgi:MFS family permease